MNEVIDRYGIILNYRRAVFFLILLCLCWYWYSGMMLQHVWDSPFVYKGADPTYWLVEYSGIAFLMLNSVTSAFLFSCFLILVFAAAIFFSDKRFLSIVSAIMLLLYQVLLNYKMGYHAHHLFAFQIVLFPFHFRKENAGYAVLFSRYLACLVYLMAGLFKLKGMGWMHPDSFASVLQNQHAAYMHFYPRGLRTLIAGYMSGHSIMSMFVFGLAMMLQLFFAAGFFTIKTDKLLFVSVLVFHVMDWLLMNLGIFMGMSLLAIFFMPAFRPVSSRT